MKNVATRSHLQPYLVGFCGRAGAGKTSLANRTSEYLLGEMVSCVRMSFAQPIREALLQLGIEKGHPLYRTMAQNIGQECRDYDEDFFVNLAKSKIARDRNPTVYVFDDVRYENEMEMFDSLLFVERTDGKYAELTDEQASHSSEAMARKGIFKWRWSLQSKALHVENSDHWGIDLCAYTCAKIIVEKLGLIFDTPAPKVELPTPEIHG